MLSVYKCLGKCKKLEVNDHEVCRQATGRPLICCGEVMQWIRRAKEGEVQGQEVTK